MGTHFCTNFEIDVDPREETSLDITMKTIGLREDTDYWFTRDEEQSRTILIVDINEHMSYSSICEIESFITNYLEPAARSTVLVTEVCNGDTNVYAIGPDSRDVMSEYHRREARKHLQACITSDLKVIHE